MSYIGNQPTIGQYRKLDDISGSFNGSLTAFTMQVGSTNVSAGSVFQLLISLGGVIQEPGTDFTVSGSTITFTTAPAASLSFFGIMMGQPLNTATPGDGTITGAKLASAFNYDSGLLFLDDTNNRVGIGTASPEQVLHVVGNGVLTGTVDIGKETSGRKTLTLNSSDNGAAVVFRADSTTRARIEVPDGETDLVFGVEAAATPTERARIDSSGRLLVGTTSSVDANCLVQSINAGESSIALGRNDTTVSDGNVIGGLTFYGNSDGVFDDISYVRCVADGTHTTTGTISKPTRLVFSTTADGASSPTERMTINNAGRVILNTTTNTQALIVDSSSTSIATRLLDVESSRAAHADYTFFAGLSGDGADVEHRLRGDGNAFCDGSFTGGGADYAEFFEWFDSNADEEDRRGISVVLDGDKIREAVAGEDPIGVISGNPSVVGDGAWNKWNGKYLRDDFGTYVQEDYEVEDDAGNTVVQQRRKLNPAYDPDVEYIPREQRPEWDCVGLMGKLRIRKGQVTGARWIKMRDISDTVEEWLVR